MTGHVGHSDLICNLHLGGRDRKTATNTKPASARLGGTPLIPALWEAEAGGSL